MGLDIIIILIAVAVSIVSAVVKGKKRQAAGQQKPKPQIPEFDFDDGDDDYDDDPWDSIRRYIDEKNSSKGEPAPKMPEVLVSMPEQIKPEIVVPEIRKNYDDEETIARLQAEREAVLNRTKPAKFKSDIKKRVEIQESENTKNAADEIIGDFNIKAAILYSEILKPKFKEE